MNEAKHFVIVFGDPEQNGDPVESGRYTAGEGYKPFTVSPGDMLLLYCTENYVAYSKQLAGIGIAIRVDTALIEYRWFPFTTPVPREQVEQAFEPDDREKMTQLRFNTRRVFMVSPKSFANTVSGQALTWKRPQALNAAAARKT